MSLVDLPFDQYQRYRGVADALAARPGGAPRRILEVGGGGESRLAAFLPDAWIVLADVELRPPLPVGVEMLRADGCRALPFRDGGFDAAVTVDTLEHLPPASRVPLVRELRRVATGPIVVACPVASGEAEAAEAALAAFYRVLYGREHRWLAEHLAAGLPQPADVDAALAALPGSWAVLPNGYLPDWLPLMMAHLLFDEMPGGAVAVPELRAIDAFYNARLYEHSNRAPAYRAIWVHDPEGSLPPMVASSPPSSSADAARLAAMLRDVEVAAARANAQVTGPELQRLTASLDETQRTIAQLAEDRRRLDEDRQRIDVARLETLAECGRVVADRDRLEAARFAAVGERMRAEQSLMALETNFHRVNAERLRLEALTREMSLQLGELRWRLGRLRHVDRAIDAVSPYLRPLAAPLRAIRRRDTPVEQGEAANGAAQIAPVSVLVIAADDPAALARTRASLDAQELPAVEVHELGSRVDWAKLTSGATGSHVALLVAGDRLEPAALAEVARAIAAEPSATVVYTDEDDRPEGGDCERLVQKPDWDPDLARSANFVGALACYRRDLLGAVPAGATPAEAGYALVLAAAQQDARLAHHLPLRMCHGDPATVSLRRLDLGSDAAGRLLAAHLQRCGEQADVVSARPGLSVRRHVDDDTLASIIIPFRDQPELLAACVDSIVKRTRRPRWELLLVDNRSTSERTAELLARLTAAEPERVRVIEYPAAFNFSAINNFAAQEAHGDVLVLLNNDTEILTDDWLATFVGLANRPDAGAVGALLTFPDGHIQHCGIALGMGSWPGRIHGVAGLMFSGCALDDVPPLSIAYEHRVGAVTAACLAVRRDRYLSVGGMDEELHTDFNDVDLCLKLAARGFANLFTPHVRVVHYESATRVGRPIDPREVDLMYGRWGDRIAYDPHLSPHIDPAGPRAITPAVEAAEKSAAL